MGTFALVGTVFCRSNRKERNSSIACEAYRQSTENLKSYMQRQWSLVGGMAGTFREMAKGVMVYTVLVNYTQTTNKYGMISKECGGIIMQNILIVEDDMDIQELLQEFLQEAGYKADIAGDGVEAVDRFANNSYDLILLDIMLPKIDGFTVCELIRKQSQVPIIMLTALGSEGDQIKGLDLQADDYVTKPFSMPVLLRKIAAVLRRAGSKENGGGALIHYKGLTLDMDGYRVYAGDVEFELTQREFEVLGELLTNQGKALSRQHFLNKLWKYDFYGDERVVDTHIKNLRKKLDIDYIETIRGVGYKIEKEDKK